MKTVFSFIALCVQVFVFLVYGWGFLSQTAQAQPSSTFVTMRLPRSIELQIPKSWWLLNSEYKRLIQTHVEAVMDLSGMDLPEEDEVNLIAANSMPRSTYAAVKMSSATPPSVAPLRICVNNRYRYS